MGDSSVEHQIAGAYQIDALLRGWRFQRAWHRARLDLVAHLLPPDPGARVLDAASGSGIVTWRFRAPHIVSADMRVSGGQAVRAHTPGARAVAATLDALPFPTGTFDQLYLFEAIEHLSRDEGRRALSELRRVARPGAHALFTTPNYRSYWVVLERVIDALRLTPPMADAQHLLAYDGGSLRDAVESTGWRLERLGSFNLIAPFVGMLSWRAGARAVGLEVDHARRAGALLFALCAAEP